MPMTPMRSLCWKEDREQRHSWLAVAILAIAVVLVPSIVMNSGGNSSLREDGQLRFTLFVIVLVLTATYGVVCGGMLLAGEREGRTEAFLNAMPVSRARIWAAKVA